MTSPNPNARLEAFSDGVFAIALTLLIIDVSVPATAIVKSDSDLWLAIKNILPSMFAFLLSFIVIFITWVNHHLCLNLINRTSILFVYANGLLLATVVLVPFPTALLGEHLFAESAAPGVVLYNAVIALQAAGWVALTGAALRGRLTKSDRATAAMRSNHRSGYLAVAVYSILAMLALWHPLIICAITTLLWLFWLIYGIRNHKIEEPG